MNENATLIKLAVDENLRTITTPGNGIVFGVVGDVEVNRVVFSIPKYFGEFDMSEFTARVNYVNANGDANYYEADDMASVRDEITFTWLLESDVTSYIGNVTFSIKLYKKQDNKIIKVFNTRPAIGRIFGGLDVDKRVTPEQQQTLLEKLEAEIKENIDAYLSGKEFGKTDIPDNVVLFEEVDEEDPLMDIPTIVEQKIKENLSLDADDEYMYLLYSGTELGRVPIGSGATVVACTGITINESDISVDVNDESSHTLTTTITPVDCTLSVKWFSSNPLVATISSDGTLTIVGEGSAVITVRCGNFTDTINVQVTNLRVEINVAYGFSWFDSNGIAQLGVNAARAHSYYGAAAPAYALDTNYVYGVPLKKGVKYTVKLDAKQAQDCYCGSQIYDSSTHARIIDAGWKAAGVEYTYTPDKDNLYLYLNFKYGSAGSTTITEEIRNKMQAGISISTEVIQ